MNAAALGAQWQRYIICIHKLHQILVPPAHSPSWSPISWGLQRSSQRLVSKQASWWRSWSNQDLIIVKRRINSKQSSPKPALRHLIFLGSHFIPSDPVKSCGDVTPIRSCNVMMFDAALIGEPASNGFIFTSDFTRQWWNLILLEWMSKIANVKGRRQFVGGYTVTLWKINMLNPTSWRWMVHMIFRISMKGDF